ncbi:MAG: diguanylate cyclase, partial [Comamonas sp.]
LACTLVGAWPGSVAFDVPLWRSALLWLSTEFYNFVLLTPLFLAAPKGWLWHWPRETWPRMTMHHLLPLVALVGCEILSLTIGGPGAIAFIMPAMVWCAMTFGVFPTTVISLLVCFWKTATIAMGAFSFTPDHALDVTSYRTGLALLSLAPLAVACAYALRSQALQKLKYAVSHDFLTGTLSRRAFMERSQKLLSRLEEQGQPVAVLMLDIDHFKRVNDQYGHAQGDMVLQDFAALASGLLRADDLLGRMGGEEFAVLLPRTHRDQALIVAQRICEAAREHIFPTADSDKLHVTLSVGLHAVSIIGKNDSIEQLLTRADEALYQAKHGGRNQVRQYGPALAPSSV